MRGDDEEEGEEGEEKEEAEGEGKEASGGWRESEGVVADSRCFCSLCEVDAGPVCWEVRCCGPGSDGMGVAIDCTACGGEAKN